MSDSYVDHAGRHEIYLQRLATELLNKYGYENLKQAYRAARLNLMDRDWETYESDIKKPKC